MCLCGICSVCFNLLKMWSTWFTQKKQQPRFNNWISFTTLSYAYLLYLPRTIVIGTCLGAISSMVVNYPPYTFPDIVYGINGDNNEPALFFNFLVCTCWGSIGGILYPVLPCYICRRLFSNNN